MHIADGYLSPQTVIASYALTIPLWVYAFKKLKAELNEETLPKLAALSALSFIIMMFNIPVPGGSSAHAVGTALLAILFGPWVAFIAISMVLLIQALVFGDGGITAIAVEALAMGFVEAFVAYFVFNALKKYKFAPFVAGYISIIATAFVIGLVLGLQANFTDESGKPLYFPFGVTIAVPAMVLEHLLVGLAEGIFTQVVYTFLQKEQKK
jgi:cobalt/nickel transport system permease protein